MGALFEVDHLTIGFPENGQINKVVDDISFEIGKGEILGVVGESGSGKSMTALAAMGLLSSDAQMMGGHIRLDGRDILALSKDARSELQGNEMSMIFQEPMTSLNPVMKIGRQVGESLLLHTKLDKEDIRARVIDALKDVGLREPEALYDKYPHELSGGMRQRVMIAQAMICSPKLLIADEPTTALDVIVQDQILRLLGRLHEEKGVSILFISHDLNVIKEICSNVIVMYKGVIVERGRVRDVLEHPQHEYTRTLVASIPKNASKRAESREILKLSHLDVFYQEKTQGFFKRKSRRQVVKDLSLSVFEGEIMGIVGESGCGKSTLAKTIVGLNTDYEGEMKLAPELNPQMVFQDPFGSLNPARKIGWILSEPLRVCGVKDKNERRRRVLEMLCDIGLDESYYDRYANELSGGQRQRISIGTALLMNSGLLVADEPVSALDVTVQSQILNLLLDIHKKRNLTILFISHDLNIVRHICHRVAVIYLGEIVEMADVDEIYARPLHPYTRLLFESVVSDGMRHGEEGFDADMLDSAAGIPDADRVTPDFVTDQSDADAPGPNLYAAVDMDVAEAESEGAVDRGCPFYARCAVRLDKCRSMSAPCQNVTQENGAEHFVKCWNLEAAGPLNRYSR